MQIFYSMTEIKLLELTAESKEKQTAKIKIRKNKQPTRKEINK